jgi:hypothetical protein
LFNALRTAAITAWAIVLHEALLTIALFSLVRGPRLDEWCRMFSGDTYYRRSNLVWVSGRQIVGSTQQAVASGGPLDGWLVRVQNVPSKTDRTGQKWVGKFMWYVLDRSSPRNFPAQWLRWELTFPCPAAVRTVWPAFSPTGDSVPFSPARARTCLHVLLTQVGGSELADMHAWHDWRATIASALKGANKSDAEVQAAVCWASAASVQLYGQMTPERMAALAEVATTVDASRHAHLPTPHFGPHSLSAELDLCAEALIEAGSPPKPAKAASKSAPPAPSGSTKQSNKPRTKRRRPSSPSQRAAKGHVLASPARFDIGAPHGIVSVDTSVPLAGEHANVRNAAWQAGVGSTECQIAGFAHLGGNGVYIVVSSDDNLAYPFSADALRKWASLSARQEITLLPATSAPARQVASVSPQRASTKRRTPTPRTPTPVSPRLVECRRSPRVSKPPSRL